MGLKRGIGLEKWEIAVTKKLVDEFRRRSRILAREEFDDLVQECLVHWIAVRSKLVPGSNGPPVAYMSQVLRNKFVDSMRQQAADKRRGGLEMRSLDAAADDSEDGMLLSELIAVSGHFEAAYQVGSDRHHSRIDVRRALSKLTPARQRLSVMLGVHGLSIKEAAEQLRIPRSTLYEEIKRIRQVFIDHRLDDYLED